MYKGKSLILCAFLAVAGVAGCGGGGGEEESPRAAGGDTAGEMSAGASGFGTASISGSVAFTGSAPTLQTIKMDADPYCKMQHPEGDKTSDTVVNSNGTLKWVFVYVKEGVGGGYDVPEEPVVLDQKGCRYHPHVFGTMAGQSIKILNSDETLHNIHALPENSRQFNLAMPRAGMELTQRFKEPEVMVRIKCDVHPWMETWAGVLNHPFYAVTGDDGMFQLERLPAGTYTIEAWHEEYGTKTQEVTIGDGEMQTVNFTFEASA